MKPFKFLKPQEEHRFRFCLHFVVLELIYTMPEGEMNEHEEMSVRSMIQDVIDTWKFYRNNIDQNVLNIIEETLADHLIGHSKVIFID